jgi:hypothetical protein
MSETRKRAAILVADVVANQDRSPSPEAPQRASRP